MRRHVRPLLAVASALALGLAGCGGDGPLGGDGADGGRAGLSGEVLVAAASSLTDAFTELGADLERRHPDVTVTFTFGSSSSLAAQVLDGAPADVLASADERSAGELAEAGRLAGEPVAFATNHLVVVTRPGNPDGIGALADLADVGVVALCAEEAPCGRLAGDALDAAGVALREGRVTRAPDARATLTAVTEGDADAAVVYATDAAAAGGAVDVVEVPEGEAAATTCAIAVVEGAGDPDVARAFVDLVTSPAGRRVLAAHGFGAPP